MFKDNLKTSLHDNGLNSPSGLHSGSKLQFARHHNYNSNAVLPSTGGLISPKDNNDTKTNKLLLFTDEDLFERNHSHALSPTIRTHDLRKSAQVSNLFDTKPSGSDSIFTRKLTLGNLHSGQLRLTGSQTEKQTPEKDYNVGYFFKRDKKEEPNELKAMDQISERFKKLSREQQGKMDSDNYTRLTSDRVVGHKEKRNINEISTYLKPPTKEQQKVVFTRSEPLNDIIHKKLGLDPVTKQRQENCFVSVVGKDIQVQKGVQGGVKRSIFPSFSNAKDETVMYQKILPHDILEYNEKLGALEIDNQMNSPRFDQLGEHGGFNYYEKDQLDRINQRLNSEATENQEEKANYSTEPDKFSMTNLNTEAAQDGGNYTARTLSLLEIDPKEEFITNYTELLTRNELNQTKSLKVLDDALNFYKNDDKSSQQTPSQALGINKLDLKQLGLNIDREARNDLTNKLSLAEENIRLNDEIEKLKAKLKFYEEHYPKQ